MPKLHIFLGRFVQLFMVLGDRVRVKLLLTELLNAGTTQSSFYLPVKECVGTVFEVLALDVVMLALVSVEQSHHRVQVLPVSEGEAHLNWLLVVSRLDMSLFL